MRKICFGIVLALMLISTPAMAQLASKSVAVSPETKELVIRLMEANGVRQSIIQIFEDIISRAPEDQQNNLREILKSDAIIENIVPVYVKHFTPAELKELIAFYKSPVGAKNLSLTPVLMTEVMEVTGRYFEDQMNHLQKSEQVKTKP